MCTVLRGWLTGHTAFLVQGNTYRGEIYLSFALLTGHPG